MLTKRKLSPSAIDTFLESPRAYYYRYLHPNTDGTFGLESLQKSTSNYDHDLLAGKLWAAFVDRFYRRVEMTPNSDQMLAEWMQESEGWVAPKLRGSYTDALHTLALHYYSTYNLDDNARLFSEMTVEDEHFTGRLDGLSSERVIHEVKLTRHTSYTSEKVWLVQNSTQIKMYAFLTDATGVLVELGYKDSPYETYRAPVKYFTDEQKSQWRKEYLALAKLIWDTQEFPCTAERCSMVTKAGARMCQWRELCQGNQECMVFFQPRGEHR